MIPYEKRGCVISLDNSWRITVDHRMHITCCACAYQLLCKRTTVVVRPKILTSSTTYTMFFNNISVIFQQKEGESLTYDTPSFYLCFHIESLSNKKSNTSINTMPSSFWYFLMRSPVITYFIKLSSIRSKGRYLSLFTIITEKIFADFRSFLSQN